MAVTKEVGSGPDASQDHGVHRTLPRIPFRGSTGPHSGVLDWYYSYGGSRLWIKERDLSLSSPSFGLPPDLPEERTPLPTH